MSSPVDEHAGITAVPGPGGAMLYLKDGTPWLARGPALGLAPATEFLVDAGVTVRVDLRHPAVLTDHDPVPSLWREVRVPLPAFVPAPWEHDRSAVYLRHRTGVRSVGGYLCWLLGKGEVPVVHCQAGADRTGAVIATVLLPYLGPRRTAEWFAAAAAHAGHPRDPHEIDGYLATLAED